MRVKQKILLMGAHIGILLVLFVSSGMAMKGPGIIQLDSIENMYEAVTFDHDTHVGVASCATCHHHTTGTPTEDKNCVGCHKNSKATGEVACSSCHTDNPGVPENLKTVTSTVFHTTDRTGLKRAYHLNCVECHKNMGAPVGCEDCHQKKETAQ